MFHTSSRNSHRLNADGTANLYCFSCGEFVSKATMPMRVQCALCQRATDGEVLTNEAIEFYKQGKTPVSSQINMLVLPDVPGKEEKKFRLGSMTGNLLEAIGIKRKKKKELPSQAASRESRRGRIFEGTILGNMQQVNHDLDKDKK